MLEGEREGLVLRDVLLRGLHVLLAMIGLHADLHPCPILDHLSKTWGPTVAAPPQWPAGKRPTVQGTLRGGLGLVTA